MRQIESRGLDCKKAIMVIMATVLLLSGVAAAADPLPLVSTKSGITMSLGGTNGVDWAVEHCFHDRSVGDQIIYLKSHVPISLAHNERNSIMVSTSLVPRVLGVNGPDGQPDSGDEGDIHYKIDRDMQAHSYAGARGSLPAFAPLYSGPFNFDSLTYDGSKAVKGSVGDNGEPWGSRPLNTTSRFAYGQNDEFGNEWHTLTFWDNDIPLLTAKSVSYGRQGASDGHSHFICVNPVTPVIQLNAPTQADQFYTTPIKTYHVPKIWPQTSYVTGGVTISFVNLTNAETIQYRLGDGQWQTWNGQPLTASNLIGEAGVEVVLEARCGAEGAILRRTIVRDPEHPAPGERHGYMLWADETELAALRNRLHNVEPFKVSYNTFRSSYYQNSDYTGSDDTRGGWRSGAGLSSASLNNALVVAVEGAAAAENEARAAKIRLLRMARLQPVGFEPTVSNSTPAKDFLSELGQTLQQFADCGIAYDLLAAHYRSTDHAGGMTPVEEICIREGLAKIAKSILQYRGNYSATSGAGDTHWAHGYELAFGTIAMAMPTYKSAWYGASGADRMTLNNTAGGDGKFWNPFPDQGVTWYQCATDPAIETPGHPNVIYPFRAEFLLTDDGWWTGPNDLAADGDRYFTGPMGRRLVDVKYGGLANAEGRVELIEMSGYESPFVERLYAFDLMRRLKGDTRSSPLCVRTYLRRRLVGGTVGLSWNSEQKIWMAGQPRIESAVYGFNRHNNYAAIPQAKAMVGQFLSDLKAYYNIEGSIDAETRARMDSSRKIFYGPWALALCADVAEIGEYQAEPNHQPILRPMFKHVVRPGEQIYKDIIAVDPDGDELTISVAGLPAGATFDAANKRITWTPGAGDAGVHLPTVTVSDGQAQASQVFPMIVKADAPAGPVAAGPSNLQVTLEADGVNLSWQAPSSGAPAAYIIYRDGAPIIVLSGTQTSFKDASRLSPGSNTRYHVAAINQAGAESTALGASPAILHTPLSYLVPGSALEVHLWRLHAAVGDGSTSLTVDLNQQAVVPWLDGGTQLQVLLTGAIDPATLNANAVLVSGQQAGELANVVQQVEPGAESNLVLITLKEALADGDWYSIRLADTVKGLGGETIVGDGSLVIGVLLGDVNGSGEANERDIVDVRQMVGQPLTSGLLRYDVDRSGTISGKDMMVVRSRLGKKLPPQQ